jgi:hypothetical protein
MDFILSDTAIILSNDIHDIVVVVLVIRDTGLSFCPFIMKICIHNDNPPALLSYCILLCQHYYKPLCFVAAKMTKITL